MMLYQVENPRTSRRAAFSLAELVISIGILILMMALAGQVFSITIKSTGQATALTEITQQLRVLEDNLREDLRNVQRGQSVLYIEANPVNAYWTQNGKDADDDGDPSTGYGAIRDLEREKLKSDGTADLDANGNSKFAEPRADTLMFFTARKATSFIDPKVSSRMQQVVYSHAEMGEYDPDPAVVATTPMATTAFPTLISDKYPIPAQRWHLARRSVLLVPTALPNSSSRSWNVIKVGGSDKGLGIKDLREGESDVISDFRYDDLVVRPWDDKTPGWGSDWPWFVPSVFGNTLNVAPNQWQKPYSRSKLDASPPMMMANRIAAYFLPNCASFKVEWSLDPESSFVNGRLDGISEVFWIDHGNTLGGNSFPGGIDPLYSIQKRIDELKTKNDVVSKDQRAKLESLLCDQVVHADGDQYSLADRFRGRTCQGNQYATDAQWLPQLGPNGRASVAVFTATRPHVSTDEFVPDDIWPAALRITVDLYDREFRLERPIRHVMVIPVGG